MWVFANWRTSQNLASSAPQYFAACAPDELDGGGAIDFLGALLAQSFV